MRSLFIGVIILGFLAGCDDLHVGSSPETFADSQGRSLTWDGGKVTLDNKKTHSDPMKRFIILEGMGSLPGSDGIATINEATLNKISNKVHNCSGTIQRQSNKLEVAINGRSDRCKLFNGSWSLSTP